MVAAAIIIAILSFLAFAGISYLIVAGLVWVVCFAFGLEWSWLISLGIWVILILLKGIFSIEGNSININNR